MALSPLANVDIHSSIGSAKDIYTKLNPSESHILQTCGQSQRQWIESSIGWLHTAHALFEVRCLGTLRLLVRKASWMVSHTMNFIFSGSLSFQIHCQDWCWSRDNGCCCYWSHRYPTLIKNIPLVSPAQTMVSSMSLVSLIGVALIFHLNSLVRLVYRLSKFH